MTEQERFEKWFTRNDCDKTRKSAVEKDSKGEYRLMCARTDWLAWQASAEADRWISVDTQPPPFDIFVWVLSSGDRQHKAKRIEDDYYWVDDSGYLLHVTHWQPLPKPPKD